MHEYNITNSEVTENAAEIQLLSSSIADALDMLYIFNVMHSDNSLKDVNKSNGAIYAIRTAAEKLSKLVGDL